MRQGNAGPPRAGLGRRGVHVPCVFWPSAYVPQEICRLAASPDGEVLAAACRSGQVYIFRCCLDGHGGGALRLDPTAVALSGWLGPARVQGLDFCHVALGTELAGLSSGLLLVCLLASGQLRLLDVADGRCVATVPPLWGGQPAAAASTLRVLQDGRHAAVAGAGGGGPRVVDLWSNRLVAAPSVPGEASILRLAAPRCLPSRTGGPGTGGGPPEEALQLAAHSSSHLLLWRWRGGSPEGGGRHVERVAPLLNRKLAAGDGPPVALALQDGLLLLATRERLLAWSVLADGLGPQVQVDWAEGKPSAGFAGAELLPAAQEVEPAPARSSAWERLLKRAGLELGPRRRAASAPRAAPRRRRGEAAAEPAAPALLAWAADGRAYAGALGGGSSSSSRPAPGEPPGVSMRAWVTLPPGGHGECCCWWRCGDLVAGAVLEGCGDAVRVRAAALDGSSSRQVQRWPRAVDLEELWRTQESTVSCAAPAVSCSAAVEARGCTWLVLGLGGGGGEEAPGRVRALAACGGAEEARELPLPPDLAEPTCLAALGGRFLAAGGSGGLVCWWSLSDWALAGAVAGPYRVPVLHLARVWSPHSPDGGLAPESALVAAIDELGKCRIVDLEAGEVLVSIQSQSGPSLWLDEPLRFSYDSASRYVCAATPGRAWSWDAASGAFEGSVALGATGERSEGPGGAGTGGRREGGSGGPAGSGGGRRGP